MRIGNINDNNVNFKRVIKVLTNVRPLDDNGLDYYTSGVFNTCAKDHTRFKNKKVTNRIKEFLQQNVGDIDEYDNTAIRRFNDTDCFYYTGKDAKKYFEIMKKMDKQIAKAREKFISSKRETPFNKSKTHELSIALRRLYEYRDRKLMGLAKENSQIILDVDEELGLINSINYFSLVPSDSYNYTGFLKWESARLDKTELYASN